MPAVLVRHRKDALSGWECWEIVSDESGIMSDGIAGTLEDPIVVNSAGEEQYVGCTGCPADSHNVLWITVR